MTESKYRHPDLKHYDVHKKPMLGKWKRSPWTRVKEDGEYHIYRVGAHAYPAEGHKRIDSQEIEPVTFLCGLAVDLGYAKPYPALWRWNVVPIVHSLRKCEACKELEQSYLEEARIRRRESLN
jgi:hypothetical protein